MLDARSFSGCSGKLYRNDRSTPTQGPGVNNLQLPVRMSAGPPNGGLIVEDAITPLSGHGGDPVPSRYVRRREHNNFVAASPLAAGGAAVGQPPTMYLPDGNDGGVRPGAVPRSRTQQVSNAPTLRPVSARRGRPLGTPAPATSPRGHRPTSAPGQRPDPSGPTARPSSAIAYGAYGSDKLAQSARAASAVNYVGWWMPDDDMLRTPVAARRSEAEDLQQELTMTAGVLRSAQSRLAEEREHRLRARAGEELAMVDIRRMAEETRQLKEDRRAQDRMHVKALTEQRRALEGELKRVEGEQEAALSALKREREQTAEMLREAHADHTRELEEQLLASQQERELLLQEAEQARRRDADELTKAAELETQAKLEREKEKRVEHLQGIGVRRLLKQGLARGWSAWHEVYKMQQRRTRLLLSAGNRLARPKLFQAYSSWRHDWEATQASKDTMTHEQQMAHEIARRQAAEAEVERLRNELSVLRNAMANDNSKEDEIQKQLAQQLEQEKEKRVTHLQQVGMRRLLKQGLARGWSAWHEVYSEALRQRQLLRKAGSRLGRPQLVASYHHWYRDWRSASVARANMTQAERLAAEAAERTAVEDQLRRELKQALDDLNKARGEMLSGRGAEEERKRLLEEQLEAEREKRVAHLGQVGIRRLMQQGLARGWTAWHDMYAEKLRQRRLLKQAGNRLTRPKLSASYVHWRKGWEIEVSMNKSMTHEELLAAEVAASDAMRLELNKLKKELEKARANMMAGRGKEAELQRRMEEELEAEKEKRVAHLGQMGVRRLMQQGLARGWTAWHDQYADAIRQRNILKQAGARLTKPKLIASYTHWRRDFEAETASKKLMTKVERSAREVAQRQAAEESLSRQLAEVKAKLVDAQRRLGEGEENEAAMKRKMESELEVSDRLPTLFAFYSLA